MAGRFKYVKRSESKLQERANQSGGGFEGFILDEFATYRTMKGDHWIRILPPTWSYPDGTIGDHFGMDVWTHFGVGPDNGSVLCLQKMKDKPCPLCEQRAKLERSGDEDEANALKPVRRVLMWILNRKDEKRGPVIWACPWTVDRDIAKISKDTMTGVIYYIDDPDDGYDISFEREGEGRTTKYTGMQLARRPSTVPETALDYIQANPLDKTLRWRTYDEIKRMYEGAAGSDDDEKPRRRAQEDEEPPRRRARDEEEERPRRRTDDDPQRRPRDDDDDDDEPRPGKRARMNGRSRDDDDDDDIERDREAVGQKRENVEDPPPRGRDRADQMRKRFSDR
jgi:hypothetical protein